MQHDSEPAIRFLRMLHPAGPWLLVAIAVDQLGIEGRTIDPNFGDPDAEVAAFLRKHHDRNCYYTLNVVGRALHKKPERVDMARVPYLHVDVDPRLADKGADVAEHLKKERERIINAFRVPPSPIPQPTACVFSGGGYQALWRLETPIEITGETEDERIASAEDAKRYNLQLEWAFGADHCHNIDRIMRLPGTVNWPDAKKRAKGRTATQAELVWFDLDASLPLSSFTPAPLVQSTGNSISSRNGGAHQRVVAIAPGNVRRYTIDELSVQYPAVNKRAWVVVVQGKDPDDVLRHDGRSEWLFYACCEMTRGGVPDDVMYSVITDPDFAISESVIEKRSSMERYALRQIERAKEQAIDPALAEMNQKHFVIRNYGGKCRVLEEIVDPVLKRPILTVQSFEDLRNSYMHRRVQVGTTKDGRPLTDQLGKWWLQHELRRQYDRVVFAPQREIPNAYNLWQGFSVEPRPGNGHVPFLDYIRELCGGEQSIYSYLIAWMAMAVQHPDRQGEVAIVLRGQRGSGKSFFAKTFGALFGRHFLQVSNGTHLVGQFNAQLRDAVIVFADEAFFAGDKKHESVLKTLITEETQISERKHIDAEVAPNYVHLIMASNDNWVVPAGHHERRFLVLDVPNTHLQDHAFFENLRDQLERDERAGMSNLLYYLQTFDLKGFNVRKAPRTEALRDQKILSLDSISEWMFRKLEEGILLPDHTGWTAPVIKDRLVDDYLIYSQRVGTRRSTATMLGRFLNKVCPKLREFTGSIEIRGEDGGRSFERKNLYEFPPLDDCRRGFEKEVIGDYPWREIITRTIETKHDPF